MSPGPSMQLRQAPVRHILIYTLLALQLHPSTAARAGKLDPRSTITLPFSGRLLRTATSEDDAFHSAETELTSPPDSVSGKENELQTASSGEGRVLDQVAASVERVGKDQQTTDDVIDPDFPEPFETYEGEDEYEYEDITQPDPVELTEEVLGGEDTRAKSQTASHIAEDSLQESTTTGKEAKGVLPEDVQDSIERAIEAHDVGAEINTSSASKIGIEQAEDKPAGSADSLAGGGKGATSAQKAAVTGDSSSLVAAEEEEDILEAMEEKLEEEVPADRAEAEDIADEQAELRAEETELEEEVTKLEAMEEEEALEQEASPAAKASTTPTTSSQKESSPAKAASSTLPSTVVAPPTSQQSAAAGNLAKSPAVQTESSLVTQGVILGGAISDMVKDNSSGIAGVVAVVLAVLAGVGVAAAGIAAYRHMQRRRQGKALPRIIEIGGLTGGRKSPSYTRVGHRGQDGDGTSGARWQAWEDKWEEVPQAPARDGPTNRGPAAKQKKGWDWDEDW